VLLQPTPHEQIEQHSKLGKVPDQLDISEDSLLRILTRYNIAVGSLSHIRGQEQIFGSRLTQDQDGKVEAFG
jgi:hypothetical protein